MILISKYLVPKGYAGLTIYPFVFLKYRELRTDEFLINHERIHLRQQLELLIIPFFIVYVFEFLMRLAIKRNWREAYVSISFEREAYTHQKNLNYLKLRPFWSFLKYV